MPEPWVIVSGAGGALGRAVAEHYLGKGARVLALDRNGVALDAFRGPTKRVVDLGDEVAIETALEAIGRSEPIALLVNAAGLIWNEPVLAVRGAKLQPHAGETWRNVIESNLTAPFLLASRTALRMARRGGGAIVNFSSISAVGTAGQAAYAASKAGIEGLTRTMAAELGPLGIRVNAIAPGFIDVPSTSAALDRAMLDTYIARTPLRRLGGVGEIVDAVVFLAENSFVNGAILALNGGLRL